MSDTTPPDGWNVDAGVDADRLPLPREPLSYVDGRPVVTHVAGHGYLPPQAQMIATLQQWKRNGEKIEEVLDETLAAFKLVRRVVLAVRNELNREDES